ncbi:MAG: hypothetical protein ACRDT1_12350 [Micromonosporaceae bacterium]
MAGSLNSMLSIEEINRARRALAPHAGHPTVREMESSFAGV